MATEIGLLPLRSRPEYETAPLSIPIRRSGAVFDALSSQTARAILAALAEEPTTISDIADTVGTSIQNTMYHTTNLQDADIVEVVDTWYSEKGRAMNVYTARCERIVLTLDTERDGELLPLHDLQT